MTGMNKSIACSSIWFNTAFQHLMATLYLSDSAREVPAPSSHAAVMKTRRSSRVSKDKLADRGPRPSSLIGDLNVWQWATRSGGLIVRAGLKTRTCHPGSKWVSIYIVPGVSLTLLCHSCPTLDVCQNIVSFGSTRHVCQSLLESWNGWLMKQPDRLARKYNGSECRIWFDS